MKYVHLRHAIVFMLTLSLSAFCLSNKLVFNDTGFEIDALQAPPHGNGSQPLTMLLPAEQGFSANVNVQVQAFDGSLSEYQTLSEQQFEQMNIKVIRASIENNVLQYEYKGLYDEKQLHWYAKAIKRDGFVYLATATSLEINWPQNRFELMKTVDSLKLNR